MKKFLVAVFILVLVFSVFACSNTAQTQSSASAQTSGGVGGAATLSSSSPSASASKTAGNVSPTTGLPGNTKYHPVQVQIDNEPTGRPQFGIQAADIVYEAMIEGLDTRLSCIFNDTLPVKVGPVRSSRVYFQWIQNEWDSIYIHDGGPFVASFTKSYIGSPENGGDMKVNIDGGKGPSEKIFWHTSPDFAYANTQEAEDKFDYQRTERDPAFKFDANVDYSKYPDVSKVGIPFWSTDATHVEYRYDKTSDKFVRYCFGKPFLDHDTNKAITVQNVIVEYAYTAELPGEGTATQASRKEVKLIGSGKAEFFVGGKHMTGTWQKTDRHAGTVYKLDDGSDLVLKPGNTWIAIQPDSKSIVTTNADGTTASPIIAATASASSKK
jgi:hypothetical protein